MTIRVRNDLKLTTGWIDVLPAHAPRMTPAERPIRILLPVGEELTLENARLVDNSPGVTVSALA